MINKITLIGNVGKDAELKKTQSSSYARFTLATSSNYKSNAGEWVKETEWHNIKVWGLTAERAVQMCKKGRLVYVDGKLTSYEHEGRRRWEVKADVLRVLTKDANQTEHSSSEPIAPDQTSVEPSNPWSYPIPKNPRNLKTQNRPDRRASR